MGSISQQTYDASIEWNGPRQTVIAGKKRGGSQQAPLTAAFGALLLFMVIYFARPEDWIPGFSSVPLAKISGALVLLALIPSLRQIRGRIPVEIFLISLFIGQLLLAAALSPVWRGGALQVALDFAKVLMVVLVMNVAVTTFRRLKILIFAQALSVVAVSAVTIWKGHFVLGRLTGVLRANYADPNDLALAVIISIPLCLLFVYLSKSVFTSVLWAIAVLVMIYVALLTGSRGGFLALTVVAIVSLWEFAIRGRRYYLLALALLASFALWQVGGGMVGARLKGTLNVDDDSAAAYASGQAREQLFWRSVEISKAHPLFGVGPGNFDQLSGQWHTTHNSFTLISSEGGIPALILYISILACGFRNLKAAKRLLRAQPMARLLAAALFASLAGYVIGSLFLSTAYAFFPYILVGYSSTLLAIARKSSKLAREASTDKSNEQELRFRKSGPDISYLTA